MRSNRVTVMYKRYLCLPIPWHSLQRPKLQGFEAPVAPTPGQQLAVALEEHEKWLDTGGREGVRADLRQWNLRDADLSLRDLRQAILVDADLSGANLYSANLEGASLLRCHLHGANLQEANLADTKGLREEQLSGADLNGARLPEGHVAFEGLRQVEELSKNAGRILVSLLLGCFYALLSNATARDAELLTNSGSSTLPIIDAPLPIIGFYIVAPLVLLALFLYLHLYMQRLWEEFARLPAVFPDGKMLDRKAYPWLLLSIVCAHSPRLRRSRPPLSRLQEIISVAIAWGIVPATLFLIWIRYLRAHEWFGTTVHIILLGVSLSGGVFLYRLAVTTLRQMHTRATETGVVVPSRPVYFAISLPATLLLLWYASYSAINGKPAEMRSAHAAWQHSSTWMPYLLGRAGCSPFADFTEATVSTRPANWRRSDDPDFALVAGAPLRNADLRFVRAQGAFLTNADLRKARLQGANLREADLQRANLQGADLEGANLQGANLQGADLQRANLRKANLWGANLRGAKLQGAKLENCELSYAQFQGGRLGSENMQAANLESAKLCGVKGNFTNFSGAKLVKADLSRAELNTADFTGAKLRSAVARGANLWGSDFRKSEIFWCDFSDTDLSTASFQQVEFWHVTLRGAKFLQTDLQAADLSRALGWTRTQFSTVSVNRNTVFPRGFGPFIEPK